MGFLGLRHLVVYSIRILHGDSVLHSDDPRPVAVKVGLGPHRMPVTDLRFVSSRSVSLLRLLISLHSLLGGCTLEDPSCTGRHSPQLD